MCVWNVWGELRLELQAIGNHLSVRPSGYLNLLGARACCP